MKRSLKTGLVGAALVACGLGIPARPADAAVPKPTWHEFTSISNSGSVKSATAYCPVGTYALGGGGQILGANGQVAMLEALPFRNESAPPVWKSGFRVTAAEDKTGTADAWSIKVGVYCTSMTATQVVSSSSALDSTPVKTATVECPHGTRVVGVGGIVSLGNVQIPTFTNADAQVNLVSFKPSDDLTEATARATEPGGILDDQFAGMWKVTAVATCGHSYAFDGLEVRHSTVTTPLKAADPDTSTAIYCLEGKRLIAAGADLADDSANTYLSWAIKSNGAHTKVSAGADLNPEMGQSIPQLTAYALCVKS